MKVEARDTGKSWNPGVVTSVNPLKVKLDSELSGVSWDEVRVLDPNAKKAAPAAVNDVMKKIQEDAAAMVKAAKDEALQNLKTAVEGVRFLATLESPSPEAFKEAKARVAAAIKVAQEKGVSKEELIEASSAMKPTAKEEAIKQSAGEGDGEEKKKKEVVIEFENPAVGEAAKEAAAKAKEEDKTLPEIIKAAVEAAQAVEGASAEDIKKAKKVAAQAAMEGSSSSSSDSSSETEYETEMAAAEKAKAKREGIAAVFYMGVK